MKYKIETYKGIRYIVLPQLIELGLHHCFTTIDMNMSFFYNKNTQEVIDNHSKVFEFMDLQPKEIFSSIQKHTSNISLIKKVNQGVAYDIGRSIENNDGFITKLKDIALISKYADCTPIILYDPIKQVHANIHSGWKGTLKRIAAQGVSYMIKEYGSNPKDIIAVLGPSISTDDFEVDMDVKELFREEFNLYENIIFKKNQSKYLINLQEANRRILLEMDLLNSNIHLMDLSTKSNPMLHSYRRDKENFGLMALVTCL